MPEEDFLLPPPPRKKPLNTSPADDILLPPPPSKIKKKVTDGESLDTRSSLPSTQGGSFTQNFEQNLPQEFAENVKTPPAKQLEVVPVKKKLPTLSESLSMANEDLADQQNLPDNTIIAPQVGIEGYKKTTNSESTPVIRGVAIPGNTPSLPEGQKELAGKMKPTPSLNPDEIPNLVQQSVLNTVADMSTSIAATAYKLNLFGEYDDKQVQDLSTYKLADAMRAYNDWIIPVSDESKESLGGQLVQGGTSLAMFALGGASGRALKLGEFAIPSLMGAAQNGGSEYRRAIEMGADPETAFNAFAGAAAVGTLEGLPVAGWMKRVDGATGGLFNKTIGKYVGSDGLSRTSQAIMGGIEEGGQEAISQYLTNLSAYEIYDKTRDLWEGVAEAGMLGGLLGATLNGITAGLNAKKQDPSLTPQERIIIEKTEAFVEAESKKLEGVKPNEFIKPDDDIPAVQELKKQKDGIQLDLANESISPEIKDKLQEKVVEIDTAIGVAKENDIKTTGDAIRADAESQITASEVVNLEQQLESATSAETKEIIQSNIDEKLAKLESLKSIIPDQNVQEETNGQRRQEMLAPEQEDMGGIENVPPVVESSAENPNIVNNETATQREEGQTGNPTEGNQKSVPVSKRKTRKGKTPLDQRKLQGKQRVASEIEVSNPLGITLQYFINRGRINVDALQSLYGDNKGKSIEGEKRARISYLRSDGKNIEQIAHDLWENQPVPDQYSTQDFREAIESAIKDYTNPSQMAEALLNKYSQTQEIPEVESRAEEIESEAINQLAQDEDFSDESFSKAIEAVENSSDEDIEKMSQDDWLTRTVESESTPWDEAINSLSNLKIDTKNTLGAFGLAPEVWNALIDGIILAVKGGKAISQAIQEAVTKARKSNKDFDEKGFRARMGEIFGEEEVKEPRVSGIKKALVPEDVIDSIGIDKRSTEKMLEQGQEAVKSGEVDPEAIVNEIVNGEARALQPIEVAALVYYKTNLDNKIDKAYEKLNKAIVGKDYESELAQNAELSKLQQKIVEYQAMSIKTAYEQSLAFRLRKMLLDSEYNLQTQITKYKASNAGVIPAFIEEKMKKYDADLKSANERLEQLEKEKREYLEQQAIANIGEDIKRERKSKTYAREKAKNIADKIREGKVSRPSMFLSSTPGAVAWDTAIELAAKTVEASGTVITAIQKGIEHIQSTKWYQGLTDKQKKDAEKEFETFVRGRSAPEIKVTDGKLKIPHSVIREFVEQGITNIEDLAQAVYDQVKDDSNITLRGVRDAITGYGKTLNLNKEEIEVEIRKMKRLGKIISGLEDVRNKMRPLRSGLQRDKLSAEERMKMKELTNEMKLLPKEKADLDKEWRSALDAIKSRLNNQIEELESQIAKGEKSPKKEGVQYDAEALALKAKRDSLKETLESIVGEREISDEQRINTAMAATERTLKELEQRIKDKELETKKKISRTPQTPELVALKEQVKQARETLKQMQDEAGIPEAKRLEAFKKRTKSSISQLEEKIRNKDFADKPKKSPMDYDAEALKLEAEKARVKAAYDLEYERLQLRKRSMGRKIWDGFLEIVNLPKSLLATADMSAPLRQGIVFMGTRAFSHPIDTAKRFGDMFKMAFSEQYFDDYLNQIKASPAYPLIKDSKLYIAEQDAKLSAREEQFVSSIPKRIPILKHIARFSERAYVGFLNKLRVDVFLEASERFSDLGLSPKKNPEEYKALADYINNATGRGSLGNFEQSAVNLSALFFSPRLIAARFNTLFNAYKYATMPPQARKYALKQTAAFVATSAILVTLAALALNNDDDDETSVELDPRSSDFAKLKIKDTRVDFLGGFQPYIRVLAQIFSGQKKSITTGKIKNLNEGYKPDTRIDVMRDFFANKLAPVPSTLYREYLKPSPFDKGKPLSDKALDLVMPLMIKDVDKIYQEHGVVTGTGIELGSFFGMGVQDYGEDEGKSQDTSKTRRP